MPHIIILGRTESGKTTLAKVMVAQAVKRGIKVAVLDPIFDPEWKATFQTNDQEKFLAYAKDRKNWQGLLVVDESGMAIGRYNKPMEWLTTTSRHFGYSTILCCQGIVQLDTILRAQVSHYYVFGCNGQTLSFLSDEMPHQREVINNAAKFKPGEFLHIPTFGKTERFFLDFKTRRIYARQLLGE